MLSNIVLSTGCDDVCIASSVSSWVRRCLCCVQYSKQGVMMFVLSAVFFRQGDADICFVCSIIDWVMMMCVLCAMVWTGCDNACVVCIGIYSVRLCLRCVKCYKQCGIMFVLCEML